MGGGASVRAAQVAAEEAAEAKEQLERLEAELEEDRARADAASAALAASQEEAESLRSRLEEAEGRARRLDDERASLAEEAGALRLSVGELEGRLKALSDSGSEGDSGEDLDDTLGASGATGDDALSAGDGGEIGAGGLRGVGLAVPGAARARQPGSSRGSSAAPEDPASCGCSLRRLQEFFEEHIGDAGEIAFEDDGPVAAIAGLQPLCCALKLVAKCAEQERLRSAKALNSGVQVQALRPDFHMVAKSFIKPLTKERRSSMSRLWEPDGLQAEVFVSHSWGEDFADFFQAVVSYAYCHVSRRCPGTTLADRKMRASGLALYIYGFSASLWRRPGGGRAGEEEPVAAKVLRGPNAHSLLCSVGRSGEALGRAWCSLEICEAICAGRRVELASPFGPLQEQLGPPTCWSARLALSSILASALRADPEEDPVGSDIGRRGVRRRAAALGASGAAAKLARKEMATHLLPMLAWANLADGVRDAIAAGADPDTADCRRLRALSHAAAQHGDFCEAAMALLSAGADRRAVERAPEAAAMFAAAGAAERRRAMVLVRSLGPPLRMLYSEALAVAEDEYATLTVVEELPRLRDPEVAARREAARRLGELRGRGAQHAAEVARLLSDPDASVREAAGEAVGAIGDFGQLLRADDPQVRSAVAKVVAGLGGDGATHTGLLVRLLEDEDWKVRHAAVNALSQLGASQAAPHSDAVARRLADEQWYVRHAALQLLEKLGPVAAPHASGVAHLLGDKHREVRQAASAALAQLQHVSAEAGASKQSRAPAEAVGVVEAVS